MADYARGETFKNLRDDRHLSQEDAAHELGVSVKTIRSWEHGGGIKWDNAKRVGQFYGVEPETLVRRELADVTEDDGLEGLRKQLDRIEGTVNELLGRDQHPSEEDEEDAVERAEQELPDLDVEAEAARQSGTPSRKDAPSETAEEAG